MSVFVEIEAPAWEAALGGDAAGACRVVLEHARAAEAAAGEISVLLADDARLQALNRAYRGKDTPTNVLSFPAAGAPGALGDIALGFETIAREAQAQHKSFPAHAAHMLTHGFLHLLGYDHEDEAEAERMEARERAILGGLGISDPYALQDS